MSSRREKLEAMLELDPQDTMARYMLALELEKANEYDRCQQLLHELMNENPPYVPAFVMSGQFLAAASKHDEAADVFRKGIQAATSQDNSHAADEMRQFLANLA